MWYHSWTVSTAHKRNQCYLLYLLHNTKWSLSPFRLVVKHTQLFLFNMHKIYKVWANVFAEAKKLNIQSFDKPDSYWAITQEAWSHWVWSVCTLMSIYTPYCSQLMRDTNNRRRKNHRGRRMQGRHPACLNKCHTQTLSCCVLYNHLSFYSA